MTGLTLLASANSQSYLPPSQLVSSTTAVLALSTLRGTRGLLVTGRPLGVLLGDQAFDPLGQLALPILPHVRTGLSQVQIALMLERLGGGAVGDPLLVELVQGSACCGLRLTAVDRAVLVGCCVKSRAYAATWAPAVLDDARG